MERVEYQPLVVQDLLNLHKSGELNITPWYQRRSVWTTPQKAYLINTLFERMPIPAIYIRHSLDMEAGKSVREVVDGQQRVRAILEYVAGQYAARHPASAKKVFFAELKVSKKSHFLLTALPAGNLLGATDADVIEIFGRINSVAKTLNSQEKRNAQFSGEMKQFCLKEASERLSFWRNYQIFSANGISRMDEVEFISDVTMNLLLGLSDFSQPRLNKFYQQHEDEFLGRADTKKRLDRIFDLLVGMNPSAITDTIFRRAPLLFSLMLVLDQIKNLKASNLEKVLREIDAKFNADGPVAARPAKDSSFYMASTSSTQRIANRKKREAYLLQHLT